MDRNELSFRYTKSGGPGGQHSNKVNTRVELTWSIADTVSFSDTEKKLLVQRLGPTLVDMSYTNLEILALESWISLCEGLMFIMS